MAKGSCIVNVRFEESLLERVKEELAGHNEKSSDAQWSLSDWVRKAVMEKIAHADRGRKKSGEKRYECKECGNRYPIGKIAYVVKPLFGKREYSCHFCSTVGLGKGGCS